MERLISSIGYGPDGTKLDAVLCPNDSIALGVVAALVGAGYTEGDMPIITGKDCDTPNVKYMIDGLQSMSVFKDTRVLAAQAVKMADAILKGGEPEINDTEKYDNGFKLVPTYLCAPTVCTVDNYKELLIDPGYYTEADIA
jgi:putative multiple sugar transport system substrate-binding protein